jgi:O-acetyl-ADP-ribose deacetylase (regulator of RNase III)
MPKLHYLIGDALNPIKTPAMIIHCCNDAGGFGRGFVVALSNKWPETKIAYQKWFREGDPQLGEVQFIQVTPDICVCNMIGQHGTKWAGKIPPIRYDSIINCLNQVYKKALVDNLTVHSPRFGAVLAGGSWQTIETIMKSTMTVDTYVYTIESQKDRWPTEYEKL